MVGVVLTMPLIVLNLLERLVGRSELLYTFCAHAVALVPGFIGTYVRGAFYWSALEACSWQVHVGFGTVITHRGARLADFVSTGLYCVIGHAAIAESVRLASRVSIPSGKRQHLDESGRMDGNTRFETVAIGARSWIGEGAVVMANIGRSSIVSAGAIVFKDMPDHAVVSGNPATVLRQLDADQSVQSQGRGSCAE